MVYLREHARGPEKKRLSQGGILFQNTSSYGVSLLAVSCSLRPTNTNTFLTNAATH